MPPIAMLSDGREAVLLRGSHPRMSPVVVHAVVDDDALSPDLRLGEVDVFVRRESAEPFIEEVRGDDPELAAELRVEERELEGVGGG